MLYNGAVASLPSRNQRNGWWLMWGITPDRKKPAERGRDTDRRQRHGVGERNRETQTGSRKESERQETETAQKSSSCHEKMTLLLLGSWKESRQAQPTTDF